jgi:BASS family bile acid:Na+ symporter
VRALLAALGRSARWALPAGVFLGVALPPLAALAKPLLTAAVIGTLTAALLRLDWAGLAHTVRRPARPARVVAWLLVVSPAVCWTVGGALGLPADLRLALLLQWAAPPIGSAAVFALILGVDGLLAMVGAVASTLLLPLTLTPIVALLLPATGVQVDLAAFAARVALVVGAPFVLAVTLRAAIGVERLARADDVLGGLNVVLLVVFAVAVMDGVTATLLADPPAILRLLAAACASAALLHAAGRLLVGRADPRAGWAAALLSGNRNMGLMLAVTAGTAGPTFSLYVGIAQIPMYFAPLLLGPLVRRSLARASAAPGPDGGRMPRK